MVSSDRYVQELMRRNVAPSHQRVMILKYLVENQCHPTVDQIYNALRNEIPTLSKATVYNTLDIFIETKLVHLLSIDDNQTRYDVVMENHGHFKCLSCGGIYNFSVDSEQLVSNDLNGFQIAEKNVYFSGICPACLTTEKKKKE